MSDDNQDITQEELAYIRTLGDFDLTMLISEIHDHGWPMAKRLLVTMRESLEQCPRTDEEP